MQWSLDDLQLCVLLLMISCIQLSIYTMSYDIYVCRDSVLYNSQSNAVQKYYYVNNYHIIFVRYTKTTTNPQILDSVFTVLLNLLNSRPIAVELT